MSDQTARKAAPSGGLTFRPVERGNWADFERLFAARGGPKHCWCMVWRVTAPGERKPADGAGRQAAMARRVRQGVPVGILAYDGEEPVAWCSIAPRSTYRALGGPPSDDPRENVWSIVCFFVPRRKRGEGLMRRLIDAAVEHARAQGATVIEAYPVDRDAPSYRFMGFVPTFAEAGFREIMRVGLRRHVMRRNLARPGA